MTNTNDSISPNARQAITSIIERFQNGDIGPLVQVIKLRRLKTDNPFGNWSFSNQVLAFMQSGSTDLRGFRQWEAVKRNVKAGEKASYILGPVTKKITDKDTGDQRTIVVGFKTIPVFAIEQTEGDPLPEQSAHAPAELQPLYNVALKLGVEVQYQPTGAPDGWYDGKRIVLGTHDWGVFFHELAHKAHDEVEKAAGGKLKGGQDVDQEVIAEFTAVVLQALYGVDFTGNAWQYIRHYAPADPIKAITRCLGTVEKVLALILGEVEEKELVLA